MLKVVSSMSLGLVNNKAPSKKAFLCSKTHCGLTNCRISLIEPLKPKPAAKTGVLVAVMPGVPIGKSVIESELAQATTFIKGRLAQKELASKTHSFFNFISYFFDMLNLFNIIIFGFQELEKKIKTHRKMCFCTYKPRFVLIK